MTYDQPFFFQEVIWVQIYRSGLVLSSRVGSRLGLRTLGFGLLDLLEWFLKQFLKAFRVLTLGCSQNSGKPGSTVLKIYC